MWELDHKESSAPKNWCFWTMVLEKTLESPLDCKEINQSTLKEISPEYSLEGLMLKLKLPYVGHLWRADSLEKTLMLGKIEGRRIRGRQRMRWLDSITDSMEMGWVDSGSWWSTGRPACCDSWNCKESDMTERLNWTQLRKCVRNECRPARNQNQKQTEVLKNCHILKTRARKHSQEEVYSAVPLCW